MICFGCLSDKEDSGYCRKCLKKLFNGRGVKPILTFNSPYKDTTSLYDNLTKKISISGVQVKYSLRLEDNKLVLTEKDGQFLLKPIPVGQFKNLDQAPANEHLTMQIAKQFFKISVPANTLVYFQDESPAYLVKRFDVRPDDSKFQQEDFAQIAQISEESHGKNYKYDLSYEEIAGLITKYISMHKIEMEKFFRLVLFNYIFSNGDAHTKNFSSFLTESGDYILTPAYDLLCTRIHVPNEADMALSLFKEGFSEAYLALGFYTHYDFLLFGQKIGIKDNRVLKIIQEFEQPQNEILKLIDRSFLRADLKVLYKEFYMDKMKRLAIKWNRVS